MKHFTYPLGVSLILVALVYVVGGLLAATISLFGFLFFFLLGVSEGMLLEGD